MGGVSINRIYYQLYLVFLIGSVLKYQFLRWSFSEISDSPDGITSFEGPEEPRTDARTDRRTDGRTN